MAHTDNDEILSLLHKLNQAHGGTVIAHSKVLQHLRQRLDRIDRRLYWIQKCLVEEDNEGC